MIRCAICGRENDSLAKSCLDCGKPVSSGGARVIPVPVGGGTATNDRRTSEGGPDTRISQQPATGANADAGLRMPCRYCATPIDPSLPFCPKCGGRVAPPEPAPEVSRAICGGCGHVVVPGADIFCARCGTRVAMTAEPPSTPSPTAVFSAGGTVSGPKIAVLNSAGAVTRTMMMETADTTIGRADGELRFGDDVYMSPVHAQLSFRDGRLFLRDLGSRNGTWLYQTEPYKLQDGDSVLIGSQILRFRRLGYPGPNPPEADATRRLGSVVPSADVAVLQQLRADGSARDSCHLSPARSVVIGRTEGDWLFPYDQTMSGRHAEVRSEDLDFIVLDLGSRNGIAVAVRGERPVKAGQRILLGDQTLRVESV